MAFNVRLTPRSTRMVDPTPPFVAHFGAALFTLMARARITFPARMERIPSRVGGAALTPTEYLLRHPDRTVPVDFAPAVQLAAQMYRWERLNGLQDAQLADIFQDVLVKLIEHPLEAGRTYAEARSYCWTTVARTASTSASNWTRQQDRYPSLEAMLEDDLLPLESEVDLSAPNSPGARDEDVRDDLLGCPLDVAGTLSPDAVAYVAAVKTGRYDHDYQFYTDPATSPIPTVRAWGDIKHRPVRWSQLKRTLLDELHHHWREHPFFQDA